QRWRRNKTFSRRWTLIAADETETLVCALANHESGIDPCITALLAVLIYEDVSCSFTADRLVRREAEFGQVDSTKQIFAFAEEDGRNRQVHLVDVAGQQVLANDRYASADSYIFAVCGFAGLAKRRLDPVSNKVESGAAFHHQRRPRVMREHKHGRVVRRTWPPPAFPGIALPRTAHRPKHVASQDPRAQVFKRQAGHVVVRAASAAALALHLVEQFRAPKPGMQSKPADTHRIVQVLRRSGAKAVNGDGEGSNAHFAHREMVLQTCFPGYDSLRSPPSAKSGRKGGPPANSLIAAF